MDIITVSTHPRGFSYSMIDWGYHHRPFWGFTKYARTVRAAIDWVRQEEELCKKPNVTDISDIEIKMLYHKIDKFHKLAERYGPITDIDRLFHERHFVLEMHRIKTRKMQYVYIPK